MFIGNGELKGAPYFAELNRGNGDVGLPSAIALVAGTFTTPTDIDRIQAHDGVYIIVNETGSFIQTVTLNGIRGIPVFAEFIGRYQGNVGHNVNYLMHNYDTTVDDDSGVNLVSSVADKIQKVAFPLVSSDYVSGEEAQVLLEHTTAPTGSHNLYTDMMQVVWAAVIMPTVGPPVVIDNWIAGESKVAAVDAVNGFIVPRVKGRYNVDIIGSVWGLPDSEVHIHLFVNGVLVRRIGASSTFNSGGDATPIVGGGIIDLNAGDRLELRVFSSLADSFLSFEHGTFRLTKLGG